MEERLLKRNLPKTRGGILCVCKISGRKPTRMMDANKDITYITIFKMIAAFIDSI